MKEFRTKHQKKVDRIFNHKDRKVRDGVKRVYRYPILTYSIPSFDDYSLTHASAFTRQDIEDQVLKEVSMDVIAERICANRRPITV